MPSENTTTPSEIGIISAIPMLLPLTPVGVWIGVRMARRLSSLWFYRVLYCGMFLTGTKLLWDGLR